MDKYGIIGYPLGHSFSKKFFTEKFQEERRDATYENYPIEDILQFRQVIEANPGLRGLNVTIPYKQQVIPFLNELSDEAREIGAVNVIRVTQKEGKNYLKGYNSDIIGFTDSIRPLLKSGHRKALVLGTGGASKAICAGLDRLGLEWTYVSRNAHAGRLTYQDMTPELMEEYTVVVNCSPVGMFPHTDECPNIPYEALDKRHLLYDLVYNPEETLFLKKGRKQGAVTKNGLEMLHLQALASWRFWNE